MLRFIRAMAFAGLAIGCGLASVARADTRLQGAGATFPAPLYARWTTEYQKLHPDVQIDYQSIGSGGGIKGITDLTVDFGASDAPMNKKEIEATVPKGEIIHLPTCAGAVVLSYNIPGFKGAMNLTGDLVAQIYMGKITKWNDAKIAAINSGANLPDTAITPAYRTDGSGTTFVFTNYLTTQSEDFKGTIGAGKQVQWPAGQGGKGNDGVTAIISQTPGAIGYVELAYAIQKKLPTCAMQNHDGKFVMASTASVSAAGAGALDQMTDKLAVNIWNQPGETAYPIASFTYLLIYKDLGYVKSQEKAQALVDYINWATHDGQKMAAEMDYAPLAAGVQQKISDKLNGLTFNGAPIKPSGKP